MIDQGPWYALQLRSRYERVVARILSAKGYQVFCPEYLRLAASGRQMISVPLIPGYVFCRLSCPTKQKMVTTPGVVRIIGFGGHPVALEDEEIDRVRIIVQSGVARQPWRYLAHGTRVRIDSGPLRYVEGILVSSPGAHKLIVSISLLQRSLCAELDADTSVTKLSERRTGVNFLSASVA